jgi:monoamine oxidase
VLRGVKLGATLDLPPSKLVAIQNLGYGTNSKMMIGFTGPMWLGLGGNGQSYSDLPNHQSTWETNPSRATSAHAVLTDYSGGDRGAQLNPAAVQDEATKFLGDLDTVYPDALAAAKLDGAGNFLAHLEHWTSNPLTNGAYTCNQPGYFTTIAGNE